MIKETGRLTQIVDVAKQIMQVRGYNSFSYADISEQVGVKKASIHYYFPNKSDLVKEVIVRHRAFVNVALSHIKAENSNPLHQLSQYTNYFSSVLFDKENMCVCGILASDFPSLPQSVRDEVEGFFGDNVRWLSGVLRDGVEAGVLEVAEPIELQAQLIMSSIEGAMLVSRAFGEESRFQSIMSLLLSQFSPRL